MYFLLAKPQAQLNVSDLLALGPLLPVGLLLSHLAALLQEKSRSFHVKDCSFSVGA